MEETDATVAADAPPSQQQFDPAIIANHLHALGATFFEATETEVAVALSTQGDGIEKCRKFVNDPNQAALVLVKERVPSNGSAIPEKQRFKYDLRLDITYSADLVSTVVLIKRQPNLDPAKPLSSQLSFIQLPGPAAAGYAGETVSTTSFYEIVHSYVHHAVAPYFNAFVNSQAQKDDGAFSASSGAGGLAMLGKRAASEDAKGIPAAKKKFAELELSLLHLQQNVDIPEVVLHVHPVIHQAIEEARQSGRRPNPDMIPNEYLSDSSFLNRLQSDVNSWVKEIQKVTKLSRDPATGTASQEINFWLNMERALEKIDKQLKNDDILLVLDVLKYAKRFHATVSFRADTGLQEGMDLVHKYNILMKEFPIDELLSATDLGRIKDAIVLIFNHINKKIKLSTYPVKRHLLLVEAISRDLNEQILKVLKGRRLMYLTFDDFERTTVGCTTVFETWDICIKDFAGLAREVSRKRNDKYLPIKVTSFHGKLQERVNYVRKFRKQHEQLQNTIARVVGSKKSSDINALEEVAGAYEIVRPIDVLDITPEGTDIWIGAEESYNERVGRVENIIISTLRDKLASAKNANEMFRVFSKFNALFVRPKIRGAIQEYQAQLIDSVKEDIRKLQEKFKLQYPRSEAYHMNNVRDIPPISGAISWARQIERQLDMYMRHVEDVLGRGWEDYADGQKLSSDSMTFRKKLDARPIYDNWVQDILHRDLRVHGRIFDITRNRANNNQLQLIVSFDPQIIMLFKEVRNLLWLGFSIPAAISSVAKEAKRVYPFAVSLQETIRTYQLTVEKLRPLPQTEVLLVAVYHRDVQNLIAKGIHYCWETFSSLDVRQESKQVTFVREVVNNVALFQEKVTNVIQVIGDIQSKIKELELCSYAFSSFERIINHVQNQVDQLNLDGYSNLDQYVESLDKNIEAVLIKRLAHAIIVWGKVFESPNGEEDGRRRRRSHRGEIGGQDSNQSSTDSLYPFVVTANEVLPHLEPLVHEVTIRNQIMYIDPPLEHARATWYRQLQEWLSIVCNQTRIQSSRYRLSTRHAELVTYRGLLELLPEMPLQNVYGIIEAKMSQVEKYVDVWLQYQSLWDLEPSTVYDTLGEDLAKWQTLLLEIKKARATFDVSETSRSFGPLVVDYDQVQSKVNAKYDQWQREILTKFGGKLAVSMREFHAAVSRARVELEQFSVEASSTSDTVSFIIFLQDVKRRLPVWVSDVDVYRGGQRILERQRYSFPQDWMFIEQIDGEWSALNEILTRKDNIIQDQIADLQQKILQQDNNVRQRGTHLLDDWERNKPVQGSIKANVALSTLNVYETKLGRIREESKQLRKAKEALGLVDVMRDSNAMDVVYEEMCDLKSVWSSLSSIWGEVQQLSETPWASVNARKLRTTLDSLVTAAKELPAKMRQYAAFEYMQETLRSLVKVNTLVADLKGESLRERHWKNLLKQLNVQIPLSDLTLGNVWDFDLRKNEATIRSVITMAQGEMALEEYLRQVKETWTSYSLELISYQNKCRLVKGWDELFTVCSEQLNALQAMRMSPYYRVFEEEAGTWEDKLNRVQLLFDVWIDVQRQWVYLEGVFAGSVDIQHLLPVETNRFQNINTEFMAVMRKVYKSPFVLDILNIPNVQKSMERLADLLSKIQKALGEYLERERNAFPRFYFVGDEDLLEIIGNSKDIERMQKHLKKMFAGINAVTTSPRGEITGMRSREGETVPFQSPVTIKDRRINEWLGALEKEMKVSLSVILDDCQSGYSKLQGTEEPTADLLLSWMSRFPAQLVVVAAQIGWTNLVESSLEHGGPPAQALAQVDALLSVLADAVLSELDVMTRRKCEHLITELVHQRDVTRTLVKAGVAQQTSFDWLYHMRFYWDASEANNLHRLKVCMANGSFYYGFEYLGAPDRLVQTPLTDRCFLTLTQALEARLGGSPFGPAGTGKTESVKALGVALGRFVLVFCCDENFDFQAMGRIFVGLCMVGAWGCFDEFNRLEERILSAVSQQVQSIQLGLRKTRAVKEGTSVEIELLGKQVPVHGDTGIFITMNPGYAGRSNLPDNLKKLFRSIAMTKPDRELIAQVMLFSQGFKSAEVLASKIVPLFVLCAEQLTNQPHYDFGLRALKSVLVSAGNLKRQRSISASENDSTSAAEQGILIQSVCETVMPKLVGEDLPLLTSLLQDVFPGIPYKPVDLKKLGDAIRIVCKERSLECAPAWMSKILQLYQIQRIHHGLMLVGPSGSGKTAHWTVLLEALSRVDGIESVSHVIDPKAIHKDRLYGTLDHTTREWTDGLFTHLLRKIIDNIRGEGNKRQWIIFDGDVDPEWVENLNSVLDDNKLLTLPNGERLGLPSNVRIIFEVDTLKYATLATVSRCGMVWYSDDVVTPEMMCQRYLTTLATVPFDMDEEAFSLPKSHIMAMQKNVVSVLEPFMAADGLITRALQFAETDIEHIMDFTRVRALNSLFSLLNKCVRNMVEYDAQHVDFPLPAQSIEAYMQKRLLTSLLWAFSGDAKLEARQKLSQFVQSLTAVDLPFGAGNNIVDFDVLLPDGEWTNWVNHVPQIEMETQSVSQADVVVPTVDTMRHEHILYSWLSDHKPVILCGPPGSGKTMTLFSALRKLPDMEVVGLNFSSATTPDLVLKTLEQYCEYRKTPTGVTLCPQSLGKWLVVFCDEINLPAKDHYGTQKVISLLRQMVESNGFWRTSDLQWVKLERIQFVGACNPPTDPGRVPLSHRFLRHAPLVMVDYPGRVSLIQIYSTFSRAILKLFPNLRGFSDALTESMVDFYLASQERFTPDTQAHYVYSPRELTRWVRGIYEAIYPLDEVTLNDLVRVWAHEALRLFQDRLVTEEERDWTDSQLDETAKSHFPSLDPKSLQRPILFSNWLGKNYASVDRQILREFMRDRLQVFYEEELDVRLVLFNHVLEHVLRIDRVFQQMQGHMLLIGVSGSGKTTLSRFVAWMNGFSVFQIKAHNKYTGEDFDEDLRNVLRRAGCKNEKICFIMDESNVLESGFLERMNTLLANAEVPGLFEGDEYIALMNQCKDAAAKDGFVFDSNDEVYKWFTRQVMKNLHVVFTMNPPENGLGMRAATSPALFNRCVLDWFGDWNDEAFYQVGKEFTDTLDVDDPKFSAPDTLPICVRDLPSPLSYRDTVLNAFVFAHLAVHSLNQRLSKRQGKYNYCTPRHYLDFIQHYVRLYTEKRDELEDQQRHLNVGLEKLNDTVQQVEELRVSLAVKKQELEAKTKQANEKLVKMVDEQQEAERKKAESQQISRALESQNREIEERKKTVMADLAKAEPAVAEAQKSVSGIKKQQLTEVRSMGNPPEAVKLAMESVCSLLGHQIDSWKSVQAIIRRDDFITSIINYDTDTMMTTPLREKMSREYLSNPNYTFEIVNRASKACGPLVQWVIAQVSYSEILDRVGPLRQEVITLEQSAEETRIKASEMDAKIADLEVSINKYKEEYAELISETQKLKAEMERVKNKVDRSVSLIASLSSEKERWESTSKTFWEQLSTLVGDALLSAAYLAYSGYFDQQYRRTLWNQWRQHLRYSGIHFKPDLALVESLSTADQRLKWHANSLPTDDLCIENAIMIKRHNRYPLIVDPSGQAISFIVNEYRDRKITVTSFLEENFLKNLETALRFGYPILIQDVENLDPILNPVLNHELRKTSGRVLIRLGNQDIDFSPSFTLFLMTRDPTVNFAPDICSRVTFVNFTVTKSSLQTQCLNSVLSQERPDVDKKRTDLQKLQGEFSFRLRQLEKSLLQALSESEGNILDDDNVIATLEVLKKEAGEIQQKVQETDSVMKEIDAVTTIYTPFATACANIFVSMEQLSHINRFYQFSLKFFNEVFHHILKSSQLENVKDHESRLGILTLELFKETYRRVSRALLHSDQLMFATVLAQVFLRMRMPDLLTGDEFEYLISGVAPQVKESDLGSQVVQQRIGELAKLDEFRASVADHVSAHSAEWDAFLSLKSNQVPECWDESDNEVAVRINRAAVAKAFRPDLLPAMLEELIDGVFSRQFPLSSDHSVHKAVQSEATCRTPVAFCALPGYDASNRVESLAEETGNALQSVAMGSPEGFMLADKAIANAAQRGSWVLLKNVHLAPQWLQQLEKQIHGLQANDTFRLFLTMETNPSVPINLLRQSRIFMFESPPGIKANLMDSLNTMKAMPGVNRGPAEKSRLYFLVAWLHAVLQERLRYVPLGWSKTYEFNDADLECALFTLDEWCIKAASGRSNLSPEKVPWEAIRTLVKDSVYGGKIDVEFDQLVLDSFVDQLFVPDAYELKFELVDKELRIPEGTRLEHFLEWAGSLPEREPTKWLALPENAEKVVLAHHGFALLGQIQKMRDLEDDAEQEVNAIGSPTSIGSPVNTPRKLIQTATTPAWMQTLEASVVQWTQQLPEQLAQFQQTNRNDPLVRFFMREHAIASRLLGRLQHDLKSLKLVCEGQMKQTNHLRSLMSALTKGVIPKEWSVYTVPQAFQVNQWFDDLAKRLAQLNRLSTCADYGTTSVWLGGLFMPEAFITATRQAFAQRNGWSLEELALELDLDGSAGEGFQLTGLRLESFEWLQGKVLLGKSLSNIVPVISLRWRKEGTAMETGAATVRLPVYLNEDRLNLLFSAALPTEESPLQLLQNGAALLTA